MEGEKIERKGKTIQPTLKFEDPNSNEKENDNDPYICFRRREFRQARKTRRADTIGAERIRLMQKSLHRARDLIMSVSEREILKLDNFQAEHELFKARCATKACKRELNIKGDEYLFFPHKKKKIVRTEDEERRRREKRRSKTKNLHSSNNKHYSNSSNNHHNHHNKHHQNKMVHQQASLMLNSHPQKFQIWILLQFRWY